MRRALAWVAVGLVPAAMVGLVFGAVVGCCGWGQAWEFLAIMTGALAVVAAAVWGFSELED